MLSSLHVLVDLGNRHIKVEVQAQDRSREENHENREGSVLEIGHLYLHRSEFYSPTNRGTDRRRFEPHGLPIRRLYILEGTASAPEFTFGFMRAPHFEVIHAVLVILFLQLGKNDEGIASEQMRNVLR